MEIIQLVLSSARSLSAASNLRVPPLVAGRYGIEERAFEQVERIGAADDELAAPVDPIDEGFLLLGRERFARVDLIPQHVGDARPGERVVGQRRELVGAQFDDQVVECFFGVVFVGLAVEWRLHRIDRLDVRVA